MEKRLRIGITDTPKFRFYQQWIEQDGSAEVIRLDPDTGITKARECQGVIVSGGIDIHPRFYNKPEYLELCHGTDERRDEFELKLLSSLEGSGTPILGICRGLQMINVYKGGTLIPDILSNEVIHPGLDRSDSIHAISITEGLLRNCVMAADGVVNSAHHQCVDRIGDGLVVSAKSPDGVIEGMELAHPEGKGFLLLVQWHPERMDQSSACADPIRQKFMQEARKANGYSLY